MDKASTSIKLTWELHREQSKGHKKQVNEPNRRWGHTLCSYNEYLYLYGGETKRSIDNSSEAVYRFDVRKWGQSDWLKIVPLENEYFPVARDSHSANIIDKKMFVVGGSKGKKSTNDVLQFDLRTHKCMIFITLGTLLKLKGDPLEPRDSHIAVGHKDRFIIIHGGMMKKLDRQPFAAIDTITGTIVTLEKNSLKGTIPPVLESHSCTQIKDYFFMYGGLSRFSVYYPSGKLSERN